jgi:hypothetical protein
MRQPHRALGHALQNFSAEKSVVWFLQSTERIDKIKITQSLFATFFTITSNIFNDFFLALRIIVVIH